MMTHVANAEQIRSTESEGRAPKSERVHTVVVGGGQSGLAVGYHLKRRGIPFVILDANERVGDAWRQRWDSLRLFTPARYDGLPGMRFPAPASTFPTKDEMADYLEAYAERFELPVRCGVRVDCLTREGERFVLTAGGQRFEAENVVVAMSHYQRPRTPSFAEELDGGIVQLHAAEYRNPSQLQDGDVLIVGAANSGAEIAIELAPRHRVWMSGRHPGHIPFRIEGIFGRVVGVRLVVGFLFHRVFTVKTPMGRKMRERVRSRGSLLIRTKPSDLTAAGVERVPRVVGVRDGLPLLEDGRVLDVRNVVWATGYHSAFSWIELPVFDGHGEPEQRYGAVPSEPGLYFVGLPFISAASSMTLRGVGRDAERVAKQIAKTRAPSATVSA